MTTFIYDNIARVREQIAAACARVNRPTESVQLIAVSKTQSVEALMAAIDAGLHHFGENRVEDAEPKITALRRDAHGYPLHWHMIGHIQSKKAKFIPPLFDLVHSVDSLELAQKLSVRAEEAGKRLPVLLQINVSGEASKSGFTALNWQHDPNLYAQVVQQTREVNALGGLELRGLMTMAPIVPQPEDARPVFAALSALRQALMQSLDLALPELSMGMTDDYTIAIEEGATMVRVGRAIFGERH
jgi:PLP dependent protein